MKAKTHRKVNRDDNLLTTKCEDKMITQKDLTPRKKADHIQPVNEVYTLIQARQTGAILYWNGQPCRNGHTSVRYAKDGVCKECYQLRTKKKMDIQIDREKEKDMVVVHSEQTHGILFRKF